MRFRRRDAVAIAIIAVVLFALLLPEIQKSRETARRDVCSWNLRKIARATLDHEQALGRLPISSSYPATNGQDISAQPLAAKTGAASGASCFARISPYLEDASVDLGTLFSSDSLFPNQVAENEIATASISVPQFLCPSFSGEPESGGVYKKLPYPVAASNYVIVTGPHAGLGKAIGTPFDVLNAGGIRVGTRGRKISEVQTNGSAKSVLFAESRERTHNAWIDAAATWVTPFRVDQTPAQFLDYDGDGTLDGPAHALNFGPGSPNANSKYLTNRVWGPSSEHGKVVIHVFADTRTAALSEDIDEAVYAAYFYGNVDEREFDSQPPLDAMTSDD